MVEVVVSFIVEGGFLYLDKEFYVGFRFWGDSLCFVEKSYFKGFEFVYKFNEFRLVCECEVFFDKIY